jgi:hypothetical protein
VRRFSLGEEDLTSLIHSYLNDVDQASKKSKQCYETLLGRFGTEYQELIDSGFDVYGKVRCGLVHSYLIENSSIINLRKGKCGIRIDFANDKYVFNIVTYFEDFKKAIDNYINSLKSEDIERMEKAFRDKPILI